MTLWKGSKSLSKNSTACPRTSKSLSMQAEGFFLLSSSSSSSSSSSGTRLAFDPTPMVSHMTLPPFWGRVECEKVAFLAAKRGFRI